MYHVASSEPQQAELSLANTIHNGWLQGVRHCPSPNFNQRPAGVPVSLLVIHNISLPPGQFGNGYVEAFFTNQLDPRLHPYFATIADLKVSSHLFIDRSGAVTQFVSFNGRAWHAGASSFEGVPDCNNYSIGIELEGTDDIAYTDEQYAALVEVTRCLLQAYPSMSQERITGHEHIAPGRKTDPGPAFDWARYHQLLSTGSL